MLRLRPVLCLRHRWARVRGHLRWVDARAWQRLLLRLCPRRTHLMWVQW
jgi:hypothetical protein